MMERKLKQKRISRRQRRHVAWRHFKGGGGELRRESIRRETSDLYVESSAKLSTDSDPISP